MNVLVLGAAGILAGQSVKSVPRSTTSITGGVRSIAISERKGLDNVKLCVATLLWKPILIQTVTSAV